jgi:RNA polymerase sigma-70 factor (ECF subfamily)
MKGHDTEGATGVRVTTEKQMADTGSSTGKRPERSEQEKELAFLAAAGDSDAFGRLVDMYGEQARRVARAILSDHHDGDDAAQDAFLSALKNIKRYDANRPFGPWLMRIVSNAAVDRLRRNKVRAADVISPRTHTKGPSPAVVTDRRALMKSLTVALQDLPERQRRAVVLFDVEGYSHAEIAQIMDVPQGTVRSDVFHGRRALRQALQPWKGWKEEHI